MTETPQQRRKTDEIKRRNHARAVLIANRCIDADLTTEQTAAVVCALGLEVLNHLADREFDIALDARILEQQGYIN